MPVQRSTFATTPTNKMNQVVLHNKADIMSNMELKPKRYVQVFRALDLPTRIGREDFPNNLSAEISRMSRMISLPNIIKNVPMAETINARENFPTLRPKMIVNELHKAVIALA